MQNTRPDPKCVSFAPAGYLPLGLSKRESSDMRTHLNPGSRRDQGVLTVQTGRRSTRERLCDQPARHVGERKLCDPRPMSAISLNSSAVRRIIRVRKTSAAVEKGPAM